MNDDIFESIFATLLINGSFDVDSEYPKYRAIATVLKSQGYLITPYRNENIFEPSDLGKKVLQAGGWKLYNEKENEKNRLALEKEIHDLKISKRNSKWGWVPYVVSVASFIASLIAISIAYESYKVAKAKKIIELQHKAKNGLENKP